MGILTSDYLFIMLVEGVKDNLKLPNIYISNKRSLFLNANGFWDTIFFLNFLNVPETTKKFKALQRNVKLKRNESRG